MAAAIEAIKSKRPCEDDKIVEEPSEPKKKRKLAEEDAYQNQHKVMEKKPRLSTEAFGDCEIGYDQLHEFLKYAALGKGQNAVQPRWCRIHHQRHLTSTVVVVLHELSQIHFYRFYMQFKHLRKTFRHRFSLPPVSSFTEALLGAGINGNPLLGREELKKDPVIQKYGEEKRGLSSYILTQEQMRRYNYPLEGSSDCSHFVSTCHNVPPSDDSPLFGLDCEMCLTDKGSELTRVSVVDASGQCIMDELVKPSSPIRNYLTRYSGITEKLLLSVTTKLVDVQARVKSLLPPDAVLVGHSLNFDLRALEMIHPHVIDTSVLFARKGGKRFRLKFLAKAVLRKEIQRTDQEGHDPTEDATCALQLAQFFLDQGPRKVAELNLEVQWLEQSQARDAKRHSLPKLKNGIPKQPRTPVQWLLDALPSLSQKELLLGGQSDTSPDSFSSHQCKQILQQALEEIPKSSFRIIQFPSDPRYLTPCLAASLRAKLRTKLTDMLTVYAGPFGKGLSLRALKRTFGNYGHIRSIRVIAETLEPHVCIQYEVLEAAQLAIENLNGAEVAGSCMKVQRPITEMTLDCETLLKQLEMDVDNEGVIYVAGLEETHSEADLRDQLGFLKDLKSVFRPRDPRSGRQRNYCFLKFPTAESSSMALQAIKEQASRGGKLHSRSALMPPHLHRWLHQENRNGERPTPPQLPHKVGRPLKEQLFALEQDLKIAMKACDHWIKKLYRGLPSRTLCVILFPGTDRVSVSLPGFCLLTIKDSSSLPFNLPGRIPTAVS
ncbi:RNA exonuclease 5 [Heteronotia binoei]|uniref:RNA exonuclease 5 n=1 Tax=Heteronotia binoei TaxID=13085 RepID=UPI00293161A4|nr:RNA exonuclease 5 [Heteronotia binoei]XP_060116898.1 RNA exonuclease 5 [Heteronotia binoei]